MIDFLSMQGDYLKAVRRVLGVTQSEFADALDVSVSYVSSWEVSRRSCLKYIPKILKLLEPHYSVGTTEIELYFKKYLTYVSKE